MGDICDLIREHSAICVAECDHVCACLSCGFHHFERIGAIVAIAIEEVLGIEKDALSACLEESDGVLDHRKVLIKACLESKIYVAIVRLRDERHHRCA